MEKLIEPLLDVLYGKEGRDGPGEEETDALVKAYHDKGEGPPPLSMKDLENQLDGAIPQRLKDIVIYGSRLKADIAELEDLVAFYVDNVAFHKRCATGWRGSRGGVDYRRHYFQARAEKHDIFAAEAQAVLSKLTAQLAEMKARLT